jgi:hypothetical protein
MKFSKYNYILNELALTSSLQLSEASEDKSENEGGAMASQQDSARASSFSEDNQTREPLPTQEDEKPRMITSITPIDCTMSALSITLPTPMFTHSATLTQPVQTMAAAGPSQSSGGSGRGGGARGGGAGAAAAGAQPAASSRNGLKGIPPISFKGDKSLYDVFKTEWRMYKAINQNHDNMLIPYNHVMTMLGMVKGPLVSAWVQDYLDTLILYLLGDHIAFHMQGWTGITTGS